VEVPPVPWRRIAIGSAVGVLALGGLAALVVPAIQQSKDEHARRERAKSEAIVRRQLAELRADQRPHFGRTAPAGPRPSAAERGRARRALERAITRDLRARAAVGTVDGPIRRTDCERGLSGRLDPSTGRAVYLCTAVRREIVGARNMPAVVGYPLVATMDFERGRFCWCKTHPLPGEHDTRGIPHVKLSRRCAGPLRHVL
jgi:hypothetical protein